MLNRILEYDKLGGGGYGEEVVMKIIEHHGGQSV